MRMDIVLKIARIHQWHPCLYSRIFTMTIRVSLISDFEAQKLIESFRAAVSNKNRSSTPTVALNTCYGGTQRSRAGKQKSCSKTAPPFNAGIETTANIVTNSLFVRAHPKNGNFDAALGPGCCL